MDVHIPFTITAGLRRRGVDVLTSQEDGMQEAEDRPLLERANELKRVLFSQDADLLAIASGNQQQGHEFAGLIYCHQLGPKIGEIIEDLELMAYCADIAEVRNRVIFLPLS